MLARIPEAAEAHLASPTTERDQLLVSLVRRYLLLAQTPPSEWNRNENALFLLADNLLNCSMTAAVGAGSENYVIDSIKRRLARGGPEGVEKAVKFGEKVRDLQTLPSRKLWSMLYFLLRVAERTGTSGSTSGRMAELLGNSNNNTTTSVPLSPSIIFEEDSMAISDKPSSEYLKTFLDNRSRIDTVPEIALLRDLLNVFTGQVGTLIKLNVNGHFSLSTHIKVSNSTRQLVDRLASLGTNVKKIQDSLTLQIKDGGGFIRQSMHEGLRGELFLIYQKITQFESEIELALSGENPMTLRKACVWWNESMDLVAFMRTMMEKSLELSGGALLNYLIALSKHGNSKYATIAQKLLSFAQRPVLKQIHDFIINGSINDPYDEFFIQIKRESSTFNEEWSSDRFQLIMEHYPSLMEAPLATEILNAGKTRAFLVLLRNKEGQMEIDSEETESFLPNNSQLKDFSEARELLKVEFAKGCKELWDILVKKYLLFGHLEALRDYIHFGRGDFAANLLELMSGHLSKPAGALFRHALVGCLDQALISVLSSSYCNSNNELSLEIRDRMDVRLHETQNAKVLGWDVFTLDYKLTFPLNVIISKECMAEHVKISHFLWSLRRVQSALSTWGAKVHTFHSVTRKYPQLSNDITRLQLFISEGSVVAKKATEYSMILVHQCWDRMFKEIKEEKIETPRGLDYFLDIQRNLLNDFRATLFPYYNQAIRTKLAAVLSSLLKAETAFRLFEKYLILMVEYERKTKGSNTQHQVLTLEEERMINEFGSNQLQILSEYRSTFQHSVRQFQSDLDELLLQLQKQDSVSPQKGIADLLLLLDFNRYHAQRSGFDHAKYCAVSR